MAKAAPVAEERNFQSLPETIAKLETYLHHSPGNLSDSDLMLHELSEDVEEGLKRRNFLALHRERSRSGGWKWLNQFLAEFEIDKKEIYQDLITGKKEKEWEEGLKTARNQITNIIKEIQGADKDSFGDLKGSINFMMQMPTITGEAAAALKDLLNTNVKNQQLFNDAKTAAAAALTTMIDLEAATKLDAIKGMNTSWDELSDETKADVKRLWLHMRWGEENGTLERTAELEVLYRRRSDDGTRAAPYRVHVGYDRAVYERIKKWRRLKRQLNDDSTIPIDERDRIEAEMEDCARFVKEKTSRLSGTYDDREEQEGNGISQARAAAWGEITELIDENRYTAQDVADEARGAAAAGRAPDPRIKEGAVRKTFVELSVSYNPASIETVEEKRRAYFEFALAKNALAIIRKIGGTEFPRDLTYDPKLPPPSNPDLSRKLYRAKQKVEKQKTEFSRKEQAFKEKKSELTETERVTKVKRQELEEGRRELTRKTELKATVESVRGDELDSQRGMRDMYQTRITEIDASIIAARDHHTTLQGDPAVSQRDKSTDLKEFTKLMAELTKQREQAISGIADRDKQIKALSDEILQAEQERLAAENAIPTLEEAVREAEAEEARIKAETAPIETERNEAEAALQKAQIDLEDLEKQRDEKAIERERARLTREHKKNQKRNLIKKLEDYTGQESFGHYLDQVLNDDELRIIARVCGNIPTYVHKRTNRVTFSPRLVETFNDDPDVDYWFINPWAINEFNGKTPANVMEIILHNPGRFRAVKEMLDKLKTVNKIVLTVGYPVSHDVGGGANELTVSGLGHALDMEKAERLKKIYGLKSDSQLFGVWLEDLEVQEELGIIPEDIAQRFAEWMARQHLMREHFFSAGEDWSYLNCNVPTTGNSFFDTTIHWMVDAGYKLTKTDFMRSPFFKELGRANEYTVTSVNAAGGRKVMFGGKELTEHANAPRDVAERLYRSMHDTLTLLHQRSKIGGQTTSHGVPPGAKGIPDLGSFVLANLNLIQKKMYILRAIYEYPRFNMEQKIEAMLKWRNGEQIYDADGHPWFVRPDGQPDAGMLYLTYEILDQYSNPNWAAENPELWEELDQTIQMQGKHNTDFRKSEERLHNTLSNDYATEAEKQEAMADYHYHLTQMRNFKIRTHLLGMQASGEFDDMSAEEISQYIGDLHTDVVATQVLRFQEIQMDKKFGISDFRNGNWSEKLARQLVGWLSRGKVADWARKVGVKLGLGDEFLRELDNNEFAYLIDKKFDDQLFRRLAAHIAREIRIPGPGMWQGNPIAPMPTAQPSRIYPREEVVREILGLEPGEMVGGGVKLSRTAKALLEGITKGRMKDDVLEEISRTLRVNRNEFVRAGKKGGWDVDDIMRIYMNARMNDIQRVEYHNGEWQYRMYASEGTPIGMVDEWLMQLIRERMDYSIMPGPSPDDTRYAPLTRMRDSHENQYHDHLAAGRP